MRVQGVGLRVQGVGLRVQGVGLRVQSLGLNEPFDLTPLHIYRSGADSGGVLPPELYNIGFGVEG